MSARPLSSHRSRPFMRQISAPSAARKAPVTKEELDDLKRQKLALLEEKKLLKTKIARMEVQTKRGDRPLTTNKQLWDQLNREYNALEKIIEDQHRQVAELNLSDRAALCLELKEECKIVLQERLRLQDVQLNQQLALNDSKRELDELLENDGPDVIPEQNERIRKLEAKLHKYHHANKKLKAKVRSLREARAYSADTNNEEVQRRSEQIKRQIRDVEEATRKNNEKYEQSRERHEALVKKLRAAVYGDEE